MARISLNPPKTLSYRLTAWYARRRYGMQLEPLAAMGHNIPVTRADAIFELQIQRWHKLDHGLKDLAVMAAAVRIGCAWCVDYGYWEATTNHHVPAEKIHAVQHWWDSDVFSELERLVLAYAEAMTATPPQVTDEMVAQLGAHLDEAQLVELTAIVAVENLRSRANSALGLAAQGFKDRCEIPVAGAPAAGATALAGSAE
jgi:alkylhydroperoxidase family enzyme